MNNLLYHGPIKTFIITSTFPTCHRPPSILAIHTPLKKQEQKTIPNNLGRGLLPHAHSTSCPCMCCHSEQVQDKKVILAGIIVIVIVNVRVRVGSSNKDKEDIFFTPLEFLVGEVFRFKIGQMARYNYHDHDDNDLYDEEEGVGSLMFRSCLSSCKSLCVCSVSRSCSLPKKGLYQMRKWAAEEKGGKGRKGEWDKDALLATILSLCLSLHTVWFLSVKEWVFCM